MYCFIDLRYGIPPLISLILLLFRNSESTPWNQDGALETDHHATLMMPILLIAIAILLFLFTSIKLPLSVSVATESIRLRAGDFSGAVAISLLASFIFPPPFFLVAYSLFVCVSPWYGFLLNLFKHFLCWLCHTLQAIPTLVVICITQQHEILEPEHPQVGIDVLDVEGQPMQDQSSLEDDFVVVIDEQLQE